MSEKWQERLDLDGKNPEVIGAGWQVLFKCEHPGVAFPWVQIVQKDCQIHAVKVLPIVVRTDKQFNHRDLVSIALATKKADWGVIMIHERRPYPALVKDAPGDTLCELPGGLIDPNDKSLKVAALRELWEELGIPPLEMIAGEALIEVPSPASAGAQIEGYSVYAAAFRDPSGIVLSKDEPIAKYEILPLAGAYDSLITRHEEKRQCVDFKSLAAILMLERETNRVWD